MPQWWQSARLRFWLMQCAMWAILAGGLGVAALVSRWRLGTMRTPLGPVQSVTSLGLELRIPQGWRGPEHGEQSISFREPAEGDDALARRLLITRGRPGRMISPLEYLWRAEWQVLKPAQLEPIAADARLVTVAGWPGMLVHARLDVVDPDGERAQVRLTAACATLPDDQAVAVIIENAGAADASDRDIVQRVAESIRLLDLTAPVDAGGLAEMPGEIQLKSPPHLVKLPKNDPLRTGLRVYNNDPARGWLAGEFAPATFLPTDSADNFAAMVTARDPGARLGPVVRVSSNVLMSERIGPESASLPARTYLLTRPDGRALLAEFRGDPQSRGQFDSLWQQVSASVKFTGEASLEPMLTRGAKFAARLPDLLKQVRAEGPVWQWYDESRIDTMRSSFGRDDKGLLGERQVGDSPPPRILQTWRVSWDGKTYHCRQKRARSAFDDSAADQETTLSGRRLLWRAGERAVETAAPDQFLPGPLLPLVIGQLPAEPTIIYTDSFFTPDLTATAAPVAITIEPCPDAEPKLDNLHRPMRCVKVSVSGSGQVSRWYIDADGAAFHIELPGGIRAQRQDQ